MNTRGRRRVPRRGQIFAAGLLLAAAGGFVTLAVSSGVVPLGLLAVVTAAGAGAMLGLAAGGDG